MSTLCNTSMFFRSNIHKSPRRVSAMNNFRSSSSISKNTVDDFQYCDKRVYVMKANYMKDIALPKTHFELSHFKTIGRIMETSDDGKVLVKWSSMATKEGARVRYGPRGISGSKWILKSNIEENVCQVEHEDLYGEKELLCFQRFPLLKSDEGEGDAILAPVSKRNALDDYYLYVNPHLEAPLIFDDAITLKDIIEGLQLIWPTSAPPQILFYCVNEKKRLANDLRVRQLLQKDVVILTINDKSYPLRMKHFGQQLDSKFRTFDYIGHSVVGSSLLFLIYDKIF